MNNEYTEEGYWKLLSEYRNLLISEPNEDIKNLIEKLKIKLNITESIESIVDAWDDKDPCRRVIGDVPQLL